MERNGQKKIVVNGETVDTQAESLAGLLAELSLADTPLVAEVNGTIVPRADFPTAPITNGDALELVRFVGGG
jgi:thiamine biosynthesis protein ThiS